MYEKLHSALRLAAKLHKGQFRDGDDPLPYIVHPVEVVINLRHVGRVTDEDMLVAAALHDTVEESNADLGKIEKEFGERAASLVKEMTRREPSKKEIKGLTDDEIWQLRSSMLLEEIAKMSPDCQTIKLADRLSNLQEALQTKTGHRLERYVAQTRLILKTIPREINPTLWDAIEDLLDQGSGVPRAVLANPVGSDTMN